MTDSFQADLIDDAGAIAARVIAKTWIRTLRSGLVDWGGSLDLDEPLPPIRPGVYRLRLLDGRETSIIVNSVRISARNGASVTTSVSFLGNGEPPSRIVARI